MFDHYYISDYYHYPMNVRALAYVCINYEKTKGNFTGEYCVV